MKSCSKCGCEKEPQEFTKDRSRSDGLSAWCRSCTRAKNQKRYEADKPRRLQKQKNWDDANPEKRRVNRRRRYEEKKGEYVAQAKGFAKKNPHLRRRYVRQTYLNNPSYYAEKAIWRHAYIRQATPPWVDRDAIRVVYREARRLTEETGRPHEVDHIHALQGENFCGLHVPWNLRVLERTPNRQKGNRLEIA